MKKIYLLLFLTLLLTARTAQAEEDCRWTAVRSGFYCSTEKGEIQWHAANADRCGYTNNLNGNQCCCGPQEKTKQIAPTKYTIIFSLVAVFAILIIGLLIYRKNETY